MLINIVSVFLYIAFVFLWFKDNFEIFRKISLPPFVPFILLAGVFLLRLYLYFHRKHRRLTFRWSREFIGLAAILLLALLVRIPILLHGSGVMTSDDAVNVLMGKHIAEGKVPPICYYGQAYLGSLSGHLYALMFWVFGYSIFLANLSTLLFYLAFMTVHFFLVKKIFSSIFALATSFFYALPLTSLLVMSFDKTSAYPLVFFLGTAMVTTAYKVETEDKTFRVAFLGFLMGLAFWTHPISACFILTSLAIAAFRIRRRISEYLKLGLYALLGFFPQLFLEAFTHFRLMGFLTSGEKAVDAQKLKKTVGLLTSLFTDRSTFPELPVLVLLLAGCVVLAAGAALNKKYRAWGIFPLFGALFFLFYFASPHSSKDVVRYLYPLYFCLPVLLMAFFFFLKPRLQILAASLFLLVFFSAYGLKGFLAYIPSVQDSHHHLERVVSSLQETGLRYWRAEYWTAYLLTCVAKEQVIVDAYTANRYAPYTLMCENSSSDDNFLFLRQAPSDEKDNADYLLACLNTLGLKFQKKVNGSLWLIHGIESRVPPQIFRRDLPLPPPVVVLNKALPQAGYLELVFKRKSPGPVKHYRLHAEIQGFSSAVVKIPENEESWSLKLPYPFKTSFSLVTYLDYYGIIIPSSRQDTSYSLSRQELLPRPEQVVLLSGFSQFDSFQDKIRRLCQKRCALELNPDATDKSFTVRVLLSSPFPLDPLCWYSRLSQELEVLADGKLLFQRSLRGGPNTVTFTLTPSEVKARRVRLTLNFKYHQRFSFAIYWNTAALLDGIEVR